MPPRKLRSVVASLRFEQELQELEPDIKRWDEVFQGLETCLSRDPAQTGHITDAPRIYGVSTEQWPGVPEVVIYYRWDETSVTLLSIIPAMPKEDG